MAKEHIKRKQSIILRVVILIAIIEVLSVLFLGLASSRFLVRIVGERSLVDMELIASDRAHLVESYINGCCSYLEGYNDAVEIREVLLHPEDPERIAAAQNYTDRYSADTSYLEGLYVAQWDTHVLAHSNPNSIGTSFRDEQGAKQLEDRIRATSGPFCTGIVLAPVSRHMVIPVYEAVYDDAGNAIGMVGAAFFTDGLAKNLRDLSRVGGSDSGYSLIDIKTGQYIFDDDPRVMGKECADPELLEAMQTLKAQTGVTDNVSFVSNGRIVACHYMPDRDWVFVVKTSDEAFYSLIRSLQIGLILICVAVLFSAQVCCVWMIRAMLKPIRAISERLEHLKENDFPHDRSVEKYCARKDEFGVIANAVMNLQDVMENHYELFIEMMQAQTVGTLVTRAEDSQVILINHMTLQLFGMDDSRTYTVTVPELRKCFDPTEISAVDEQLDLLRSGAKEEANYEQTIWQDPQNKVHILTHAKRVLLSNGEQVIIFSFTDITESKKLNDDMLVLSERDTLTGICNRRSGKYKVEECIREGICGMFCLMDIKHFKTINEKYGQAAGDKVLVEVARTMKKTFRSSDVLIRMGGDQFIIYAAGVVDQRIGVSLTDRFLRSIHAIEVEELGGERISVSMGLLIVEEAMYFSQMVAMTSSVLYDCKKHEGNAYRFYDKQKIV